MKLVYLSASAFVIVSLFAINLVADRYAKLVYSEAKSVLAYTISSKFVPLLNNRASAPIVSAPGAMAVDLETGIPLFQKDARKKLLPASTTKIVTALVALESYPLDKVLEVKKAGVEGQKMRLVLGEQMSVRNLLYGLLVFSANDAAETLADNFPKGRDEFVRHMNSLARRLNLADTYFENPTGIDGNNQVTSARDMIRLASYAMRDKDFREIVSTKEITVENFEGNLKHKLTNLNELLGHVEGVIGVKTGWTEEARENLVTYVERDDRRIALVVLGSQDRFGETKELIEWIFNSYSWIYSP